MLVFVITVGLVIPLLLPCCHVFSSSGALHVGANSLYVWFLVVGNGVPVEREVTGVYYLHGGVRHLHFFREHMCSLENAEGM